MARLYNKRNVLIYAPTVGRGGVTRVVETLTAALDRLKGDRFSYSILGQTFNEIGDRIQWPEDWDFEQINPGAEIPQHPHQFAWLDKQQDTFIRHLKSRAGGYDLVFCPSPWWTMRPKNETLDFDRPFVTVVPDFAFDHVDMGGMSRNFRFIARQIALTADMTIFPSHYQRCWGEKFYGFEDGKTRTIHHSADFVAKCFEATFEEGQRVKAKYDLPDQYILAFHCMWHKDPVTILKAHARDLSIPLVLGGVGTDHITSMMAVDHHIEEVRRCMEAIGHKLGENLFIVGKIPDEDIAGLYVNALCAVTASRSEGDLSGMIFEAFMASTPLIFSDLEVFTERLGTDNRYGLCFQRLKDDELAACIANVKANPEAARQRALEAFGYANSRIVDDVASEYAEVYSMYDIHIYVLVFKVLLEDEPETSESEPSEPKEEIYNEWPMAVYGSLKKSPVDDTWQEFTHSEHGLKAWSKGDYTVIAYPLDKQVIPLLRSDNE